MTFEDFESIQFSLLNLNQITKCNLNSNGTIDVAKSEFCWRQTQLDLNGDYAMDYDTAGPIYYDEKWVFLEEVKYFENLLTEFKKRPVTSKEQLLRIELMDESAYNDVMIDLQNTLECPKWSDWISSACSVDCGPGNRTLSRKCFKSEEEVSIQECIIEFGERDSEYYKIEECYTKECEMTQWKAKPGKEGMCSKKCGQGTKIMVRACIGL